MTFARRAVLAVAFYAIACVVLSALAYNLQEPTGYMCWMPPILTSGDTCGEVGRSALAAFQAGAIWAGGLTMAVVILAGIWWERRGPTTG